MSTSKSIWLAMFASAFAVAGLADEPAAPAATPGSASPAPAAAAAPLMAVPNSGPSSWVEGPISYDPAGNIISMGSQGGVQTFLYDSAGRLTTATQTAPDATASTQQFSYDNYGNMTSRVLDSAVTTTYGVDAATNRLTSMSAAYDESGNLTKWQPPGTVALYQYSYDSFDMMTEANVTAANGQPLSGAHRSLFIYTADDERLWSYDLTSGVSHWTLRGLDGRVLTDLVDNSGTWTLGRDYVYRPGGVLAAVTPTRTEYYAVDHLGTPRIVIDGNGTLVGRHTLRVFGEEWTGNGDLNEGSTLRFTGHERDADAWAGHSYGLDYMHARYYSPTLGRFLSVDPARGGSEPQSWNRFSYARNTPVVATDPTGMWSICGSGGCTVYVHDFTDDFLLGLSDEQYRSERSDFFLEALLFVQGAQNAFWSDNRLGYGREHVANASYERGQIVGDATAMLQGGAEMILGFGGEIGGVALDASGVGAVAGVALNIASGAAIVHGGHIAAVGLSHMMQSRRGSGKERATDIPSWAEGQRPRPGENGKDFAKRLCDGRFGAGNYDTGPASDYNKLKKYGDRAFIR